METEFEVFYRENYALILKTTRRRLGNQSDAEDATSEVFEIAWRKYQDGLSLSVPWLYVVARNVVGTEYRRASRAQHSRDVADCSARIEFGFDAALEVRQCMAEMAKPDREILFLWYWHDLSGTQAAEHLGCSVSAVWVRLTRARMVLRVILNRNYTKIGRSEKL